MKVVAVHFSKINLSLEMLLSGFQVERFMLIFVSTFVGK
jgi:hypothetical protein